MSEAKKPHNKQNIDEDFIINNYNNMTAKEIGAVLGVSRETINHRAMKLGLRKIHKEIVLDTDEIVVEIEEVKDVCLTNKGQVFSKINKRNYKIKYPKNFYAKVVIVQKGIKHELRMHRLMAKYFIDNPNNYAIVNHIDADKHNFKLENLEWVTNKENMLHAKNMGLIPKGEKSGRSKITEDQAIKIWNLHLSGKTVIEILSECPFATKSIIKKIKSRQRWKHISG